MCSSETSGFQQTPTNVLIQPPGKHNTHSTILQFLKENLEALFNISISYIENAPQGVRPGSVSWVNPLTSNE